MYRHGGATDDRARPRFVLTPDGAVVPDVDENLPGRGLWVTSTRRALEIALRQKSFAKAARAPVRIPDDLERQVEQLLSRRCRDILGLAVRAGQAIFGYQKCAISWSPERLASCWRLRMARRAIAASCVRFQADCRLSTF